MEEMVHSTYFLSEMPRTANYNSMCFEITDTDVSSTTHQQLENKKASIKKIRTTVSPWNQVLFTKHSASGPQSSE